MAAVEVHAEYDAEAGILDVWIGPDPTPAMSYESPDGSLIRRALDGGQVVGFTIFDWRPQHEHDWKPAIFGGTDGWRCECGAMQ